MDTTKNEETTEAIVAESKKRKPSLLVLMASFLSLGSLTWTTWSMLDLFHTSAVTIEKLGGISLVGLSAAVSMDVFWTATMVASYQGQKMPTKLPWVGEVDALPFLGWIQALFVAALLGYHGSKIGGGEAGFAAVLPLFTKVTWMVALRGLKDPSDFTDEEKATLAAKERKSRLLEADILADAKQHAAETLKKERDHQAALADQQRLNEASLAETQAKIAQQKMEQQAKFDLEKAELEGVNELKAMRQRLNSQLQIATMQAGQEIELSRLDAQQEMRLRQPITLHGEVVRTVSPVRRELEGFEANQEVLPEELRDLSLDLSSAEMKKVEMAARYYAADRATGGMNKTAFCKKTGLHLPRVSEATGAYPVEWFVENGLSGLLERTADEYRQPMG